MLNRRYLESCVAFWFETHTQNELISKNNMVSSPYYALQISFLGTLFGKTSENKSRQKKIVPRSAMIVCEIKYSRIARVKKPLTVVIWPACLQLRTLFWYASCLPSICLCIIMNSRMFSTSVVAERVQFLFQTF